MSSPFLGEIKMFAGNFAPRNWALCDGQLLSVSQAQALFSLLGTLYGGDGRTTFGLPDLRGRVPIHAGSGPGLTPRNQGQRGGQETASVNVNQLPSHTHSMQGSSAFGGDTSPANNLPATGSGAFLYKGVPGTTVAMDADAIGSSGGSALPHNNVMPFLCVNFIVALFGVYPSRN